MTTCTTEWRPLSEYEQSILSRLLEVEFPHLDALPSQIPGALVRQVADYHDQWGSIEFQGFDVGASAFGVTEALATDSDGVPISYILHEAGGRLRELEILKMDNSPITCRPEAHELVVSRCGE